MFALKHVTHTLMCTKFHCNPTKTASLHQALTASKQPNRPKRKP